MHKSGLKPDSFYFFILRARGYRVRASFEHLFQTVQIRGIIMTTERFTDSHRIKKCTKKKEIKMTNISKLTCKRSINHFFINLKYGSAWCTLHIMLCPFNSVIYLYFQDVTTKTGRFLFWPKPPKKTGVNGRR